MRGEQYAKGGSQINLQRRHSCSEVTAGLRRHSVNAMPSIAAPELAHEGITISAYWKWQQNAYEERHRSKMPAELLCGA